MATSYWNRSPPASERSSMASSNYKSTLRNSDGYFPAGLASERSSCESMLPQELDGGGLTAPPPPMGGQKQQYYRDYHSPTNQTANYTTPSHPLPLHSPENTRTQHTVIEMPAEPVPAAFHTPRGISSPMRPSQPSHSLSVSDVGYSDKIVSPCEPPRSASANSSRHRSRSPQGLMSPADFARNTNPRALSPLPESFEIALPPGVQLRPHTPDQIFFHPDDHDDRSHTPADQILFPDQHDPRAGCYTPSLRPRTPHTSRPTTPASNYPRHASPAPTTAESISAYGYRSPAPSIAAGSIRSTRPRTKPHTNPMASSPYELNGLWNAAQGAHPINGDGKIFILSMFRQAPPNINPQNYPEHFTFGPSHTSSFFTVESSAVTRSSPVNEILISRKNPTSGDCTELTNMQLPLDGCPAPDGLVTLVYPKRAVLAAIQAAATAEDAISLAAQTECCRLLWSKTHRRYELQHPVMSSSNTAEEAALVVKIDGAVGFDNADAKGSIKLINMTNRETLGALDFARGLLFINTSATMKVPSKHIVDVAVSTLLAVATVEGRRVRARRQMESAASIHGGASIRNGRTTVQSNRTIGSQSPLLQPARHDVYVEKIGSRTDIEALQKEEKERGGPLGVLVRIGKGVWMLVYFTGKLGYEIVKAIVDAFKPLKEEKR